MGNSSEIHSSSYAENTCDIRDLKPECAHCGASSDLCELVDVVSPENYSYIGGSIPVWYCGSCKKTFLARSLGMVNSLQQCGIYSQNCGGNSNVVSSYDIDSKVSVAKEELERKLQELDDKLAEKTPLERSIENFSLEV